jgi:hypothetical protein
MCLTKLRSQGTFLQGFVGVNTNFTVEHYRCETIITIIIIITFISECISINDKIL